MCKEHKKIATSCHTESGELLRVYGFTGYFWRKMRKTDFFPFFPYFSPVFLVFPYFSPVFLVLPYFYSVFRVFSIFLLFFSVFRVFFLHFSPIFSQFFPTFPHFPSVFSESVTLTLAERPPQHVFEKKKRSIRSGFGHDSSLTPQYTLISDTDMAGNDLNSPICMWYRRFSPVAHCIHTNRPWSERLTL